MLKSSPENALVDAILKVARGTMVLGDGVAEKVAGGALRAGGGQADGSLSEMQRQAVLHVAAGFELDEIARRLKLSIPIVDDSLTTAAMLLDAKDYNAAALQALRRGIILIDEVVALQE
jgi:DNA-binding NarL/FixJ family response regulator